MESETFLSEEVEILDLFFNFSIIWHSPIRVNLIFDVEVFYEVKVKLLERKGAHFLNISEGLNKLNAGERKIWKSYLSNHNSVGKKLARTADKEI